MLKAFVLVKLFQYLPHFKLVFSYQTKPANVSTILNKQPPDKVHFAAILNLIPICQSCQRTPGLSSLTLGFKILGYLDEVYSTCLGSNVEHVLHVKSGRFGSFCQPVHRACVKMTSRVDKHESSDTFFLSIVYF